MNFANQDNVACFWYYSKVSKRFCCSFFLSGSFAAAAGGGCQIGGWDLPSAYCMSEWTWSACAAHASFGVFGDWSCQYPPYFLSRQHPQYFCCPGMYVMSCCPESLPLHPHRMAITLENLWSLTIFWQLPSCVLCAAAILSELIPDSSENLCSPLKLRTSVCVCVFISMLCRLRTGRWWRLKMLDRNFFVLQHSMD